MRNLKRWMRLVGGFYLFLGVLNTPPVVAARMSMQYPFLELGSDHMAVKAINDLWFVFGVETAVIGLMLLLGSASPLPNKILAQTVVLLEVVRTLLDAYWISRGYYDTAPYIIWIVIHLAIILSGWRLLQQAKGSPDMEAAESSWQPG